MKKSGLPIPGVNIQIKNSTKVLPQILMVNSLWLPSGSTVVFTYIGFKVLNIRLQEIILDLMFR
jgi:hypothetical protein